MTNVHSRTERYWALLALALTTVIGIAMASSPAADACASLAEARLRLACYDHAAQPHPAKGAMIPGVALPKF